MSISLYRRMVVTSAEPIPQALPWVSGVNPSTTIFFTRGFASHSMKRLLRPVMLGSMPAPLMFLPICSTISTSTSSKQMRAITLWPWPAAPARARTSDSAGTTSTMAVSSAAFSTIATPSRKFFLDMMNFAALGNSSPNISMPLVCSSVAPTSLPRPIIIILTMPLSMGPRKLVCGLTRQMRHNAVGCGGELVHVDRHAVDLAQLHDVHLRVDRAADEALGDAVAFEHLRWPSAVPPPWLPIAGKMNGLRRPAP